jgi:HK97 gp10 family phage protein
MLLQVGEIMAKASFKIQGMDKLRSDLNKLGKVPQKHVTASARKGMNIVLRDARSNAPHDTGDLKKGIILAGERAKTKGKKVFRVVFDRKMNDIFQRKDENGRVVAYYPVSQEYGYFTKNGRYIPGFRFIHGSLRNNYQRASQVMVDTMKTKMDAELRKAGLR